MKIFVGFETSASSIADEMRKLNYLETYKHGSKQCFLGHKHWERCWTKEMIKVKTDHKTNEYIKVLGCLFPEMVFRLITELNAAPYNGDPKELQFVLSVAVG